MAGVGIADCLAFTAVTISPDFCVTRAIFRRTGWCRAVFFGIVPSLLFQ